VTFSITDEDEARLNAPAAHFADGDRTAFLRLAMKRLEALRRAEELRDLQTFGVAQRALSRQQDASIEEVIHRTLSCRGSQ
jgi:hypothetical protein